MVTSCVMGRGVKYFNTIDLGDRHCLYVLKQIFRIFLNPHLIHTTTGVTVCNSKYEAHFWLLIEYIYIIKIDKHKFSLDDKNICGSVFEFVCKNMSSEWWIMFQVSLSCKVLYKMSLVESSTSLQQKVGNHDWHFRLHWS